MVEEIIITISRIPGNVTINHLGNTLTEILLMTLKRVTELAILIENLQ